MLITGNGPENERWELFEGVPYAFSVRLPRQDEADDKTSTVVEPDLSIICDHSKLDKYGCRGAPDWIVEVLSPSTALRDMNSKRSLYEQHGVKEYWIVHPTDRWIMVYQLDASGHYGPPQIFGMTEPTPVSLFPEFSIEWTFMYCSLIMSCARVTPNSPVANRALYRNAVYCSSP